MEYFAPTPAMSFCVVFSPYTHGRLEANWRNFNAVANSNNLFDRKSLHKLGTTCQSAPIGQHRAVFTDDKGQSGGPDTARRNPSGWLVYVNGQNNVKVYAER